MVNFEFTAVGRIEKPPVLKNVTYQGRVLHVINFEVSVPSPHPKPDDNLMIIRCSAWQGLADELAQTIHDGDLVKVAGTWISAGAFYRTDDEAGALLTCRINNCRVLKISDEAEF